MYYVNLTIGSVEINDMADTILAIARLLVAATAGLSLAHASEFPGKLRRNDDNYRTVQAIYYPGFTIGGLGVFNPGV